MENCNAILFYNSKNHFIIYTILFYNTSTSQTSICIKIFFFLNFLYYFFQLSNFFFFRFWHDSKFPTVTFFSNCQFLSWAFQVPTANFFQQYNSEILILAVTFLSWPLYNFFPANLFYFYFFVKFNIYSKQPTKFFF